MHAVLCDLDTSHVKYQDRINVKNTALILVFASVFLISSVVRSADKPVSLVLEEENILHVGQLAVLHIPLERRYSHSSGTEGAWQNVLALVRRSKRDVTFRAIQPGPGVIIISPETARGECISCATIHCFINVIP
jgi:hypothetical protein